MTNSLYNLDKTDTNILKGIAILMITIHNFVNSTSHIAQNEMMFSIYNTQHLFGIIYYHPLSIFNSIFTFFGHYGVQIFIFLSAYGLTKKYSKDSKIPYLKYLFNRLIKIYVLLIIGIICYALINVESITVEQIKDLLIFFLPMTSNFSYDTLFFYVGPWWFFSLIVQLYISFPILFYIVRKYNRKGLFTLITITYLLIYLLSPIAEEYNIPIFANFLGHLPEFLLGIGLALFPQIKINTKVFIASIIIFVASCFSRYMFPFSFITILIIMLYTYSHLRNSLKRKIIMNKVLILIGQISMIIFVINPLIRSKTQNWITLYIHNNQELEITAFAVLHTLLVIIISYCIWWLFKQIAHPIKKYTGLSIL